jgi:hypothetical protein
MIFVHVFFGEQVEPKRRKNNTNIVEEFDSFKILDSAFLHSRLLGQLVREEEQEIKSETNEM